MKANAPEKIYIQPNAHDGWFVSNPHSNIFVEYTHTDAFIEKACEYLNKTCIGTYNSISKHHLQRYFDEFSFRYNTRKVNDTERFVMFFGNINYPMTHKQIELGNGRKRKYTLKRIAAIQRAKKAAAQAKASAQT